MAKVLRGRFYTTGSSRKVLDAGFRALLILSVTVTACGKKGPPLAPLRLVPEPPSEVTLRRVGDKAILKLTLPKKNENGPGPVELDRVDIYAVTAAPGVVPTNRLLLSKTHVVGTISVKPPPAEDQPPDPRALLDKRPSAGETVTFSEELTAEKLTPAPSETPEKPAKSTAAATVTPAAAAPAVSYPVRVYTLRGVTRTGRPGNPAPRLQLPIVPLPLPPVGVVTMFDEQGLLILWTPPVSEEPAVTSMLPLFPIDAVLPPTSGMAEASRLETMALLAALPAAPADVLSNPFFSSRAAAPVPAAAAGAAIAVSPTVVAAPLTFNVYEAAAEVPLNTEPLPTGSFRHVAAEAGKQQCFAVRTVKTVATIGIEGEPSPPICVTPRDIFPPAAPTGLNAVAGPGAVNLIWNANTEPDLAGYVVLRGEAPGDTLQPLTPAPIHETNYRDATVKPGVRYVYVVVAVDTATPPNASARTARVEETAR